MYDHLISHDLKVCLYIDRWCSTPSVYSFYTFCAIPPPQDNILHFNGLHRLWIIINCTVVIIVIIITRTQKRNQVYSLTSKVCVTSTTTNFPLKTAKRVSHRELKTYNITLIVNSIPKRIITATKDWCPSNNHVRWGITGLNVSMPIVVLDIWIK